MWPAEDQGRAPVGDFPPPWASAWGDDVYGLWADLTVNGVTQRMRWIEPSGPEGFWVGAPQAERDAIENEDAREWAYKVECEPRIEKVKPGFWLADTPCTQAFWQAVTGENLSHFRDGPDARERPVESVSWDDVLEKFLRRFAVTSEWGTEDRLCLPTEVQWEYACRAGSRTAYWWGDAPDDKGANWNQQHKGTTPVKRYVPNSWGLFDMHGNVWEWCADAWRERLDAPEARPEEAFRVLRGGSWFRRPGYARAAFRNGRHRRFAAQFHGFRFALRSFSLQDARRLEMLRPRLDTPLRSIDDKNVVVVEAGVRPESVEVKTDSILRRVFISYAANDPDWTSEKIKAVASAIREAGVDVRLDSWEVIVRRRKLSIGEWWGWMDESIRTATHIVCLASPRYCQLWGRNEDDAGGLGAAFELIQLVHALYLSKQHNHSRILTLRPDGSGFDCIPPDLALDCPTYQWTADREMLLSDLTHAEIPLQTITPPRPSWASAWGNDSYGLWADLTVNGVTQRMRWINPSGPEGFWMGSHQAERDAIKDQDYRRWANEREHEPQRVPVSEGFWLADTPCTQAFWQAVTGENPSYFHDGPDASEGPVEQVSWDDVMEAFVRRFAARSEWGTEGRLCLPTEVEWEYACRAGTRTAYWWGDLPDDKRANWNGQHKGTTPVKRYAPNPWGLYDVHGNVWEWCADVWRERLDAPEARPNEGLRVLRGGSWFSHPDGARAAIRVGGHRRGADQFHGFRFALRSSSAPEAGV